MVKRREMVTKELHRWWSGNRPPYLLSMSIQPDHKALIFCATVAVLGVGVRVVRAASRPSAPSVQPALERQMQAADSAAQQGIGKGKKKARSKSKSAAAVISDSLQQLTPAAPQLPRGVPPARTGYLGDKLDLDVATAAQLDSIPGVTPTMAKRIVADRMMRGPFLNREGLRRVSGVGPNFLAKIDSLVAFSGTFVRPTVTDTVIMHPVKPRNKRQPGTPGGILSDHSVPGSAWQVFASSSPTRSIRKASNS
jgi:DNA uptake protein ComE-like DNA-binding protein